MLPLLAAGALGGGLLGMFKAKKQNKEAERIGRLNSALAVNDTQFASLGKGKSGMYEQPVEKTSVLGAALGGGLSGGLQAANVYKGLANLDANKEILKKLGGNLLGGDVTDDPKLIGMRSDYMNLSSKV
jgi:hypothetical protein